MSGSDAHPTEAAESSDRAADPVDPDIDLHIRGARRESVAQRWVLPVIALGGMAGASARHALDLAWPVGQADLPSATLVINATGSLMIGMLMVQVVEVGRAHPLLRPFLGVGLLGGYTTFSTYAVQSRDLWDHGHAALALTYLTLTPALAVLGVGVGVYLARALHRVRSVLAHRKAQR